MDTEFYSKTLSSYSAKFPNKFGTINSLKFTCLSGDIVVGTSCSGLALWKKDTRKYELICGANNAITGVAVNPRFPNLALAAQADGQIYKINLDEHKYEDLNKNDCEEINVIEFNPSGKDFVVAGRNGVLRIYDLTTNFLKCTLDAAIIKHPEWNISTCPINAVKYWPLNPQVLVSGGLGRVLKVWDVRVGDRPIKLIKGPHLTGHSLDLKGNMILTGSYSEHNALQIWDISNSKLFKILPFKNSLRNGQFLTCAKFWEEAMVIAGGTGTESIQIFNHVNGKLLMELSLRSNVYTLDTLSESVAFAGEAQYIKMYNFEFQY